MSDEPTWYHAIYTSSASPSFTTPTGAEPKNCEMGYAEAMTPTMLWDPDRSTDTKMGNLQHQKQHPPNVENKSKTAGNIPIKSRKVH